MLQSPQKNTHNERKREKERERERERLDIFGLYNPLLSIFSPFQTHHHKSSQPQGPEKPSFSPRGSIKPFKKGMAPWKTPSKIGKQRIYSSEKVTILSSKVAMVQMVHLISSELIHLSYRWCSFRKPSPEGRASATSPYLISICVTILVPRLTLW